MGASINNRGVETWSRYAVTTGLRWTSEEPRLSAEPVPADVCWVPTGAPVPSALPVIAVCRVMARLHGCPASAADTVTALRIVELPDRSHHRSADCLPAEERLAIWLAIAYLRQVSILAIPGPQLYSRPTDVDWVPRLLREAGDRHRLLLLLRTTSDFADAAGARRLEPPAAS